MKAAITRDVPKFVYVTCALVGAFVGFLIPNTKTLPPRNHGVVAAIIAFELNYINLITTIGVAWLFYWLFKRKTRGREAMVMYGALGFAMIRLMLASVSFLNK